MKITFTLVSSRMVSEMAQGNSYLPRKIRIKNFSVSSLIIRWCMEDLFSKQEGSTSAESRTGIFTERGQSRLLIEKLKESFKMVNDMATSSSNI